MNSDNNKGFINPGTIREIATGFQKSRILLTAYELDIFTNIEGHLLSAEEIAAKVNADPQALERLLNALTAMGFIHKTHGKYYNTEEASRYLVKGKPEYMSGLMHTNHLWNTWSTLTGAVRKGSTVIERNKEAAESRLDSFISAMHYRAVPQAKIINMMLDFTNVKSILDLGGGSGAFAMAFIKNDSKMKATLFDVPGVVEIAKNYIGAENLLDRFGFIKGDYLTDDYGSGYDLIYASAIIHINSFDENKNLVNKCFNALNSGGQLVISDYVMNEERTVPEAGTLFALNMLVGTKAGNTYTQKEIYSWLGDAGFEAPQTKNTSFGPAIVIAKKP